MNIVPEKYLNSSQTMFVSQASRKEFEEFIKQDSNYDIKAADERDDVLKQQEIEHKAQIEKKVAAYNQTRIKFMCPICHSERISKISNVGKFMKVSALGIWGAGDIGKRKIEQQAEMGLVTKEEKAQKIEELLR